MARYARGVLYLLQLYLFSLSVNCREDVKQRKDAGDVEHQGNLSEMSA